MNNDTNCPECGTPTDEGMMCEDCIDQYTAMAESDYEDRYYREGRYSR